MKRIKLLTTAALIIAICSSSTVAFAQGNAFDIDAAIVSALKNSYDIKVQQYNEQQAENSYEQAKETSDKANESLIMIDDMIDLKGKPNKTPEEEARVKNFQPPGEDQRYQLEKTRELGPLQAEVQLAKVKNAKEVSENTLKLNIYNQYSSILSEKDVIDIEQKKLDSLLYDYNKAKIQLEVGTISKVDSRKSEVSYINEKPVLLKQQRQMEIFQMDMNKTIGEELTKKYDSFTKDILMDATKIKTLDEYLQDALKNRNEIVNVEEDLKLKKKEYDFANQEFPDESERYNQQAKYYVEEAENNLETMKLTIQQEIITNYNELVKKAKKTEYAQKAFELAKKNYNESVIRNNLGMISKIDLMKKEIDYKQAESNLKNSQRDLWISQLKLEYQCGKGIDNSKLVSTSGASSAPSAGNAAAQGGATGAQGKK